MSRVLNISDAKVSFDGGETFHPAKITGISITEAEPVDKHNPIKRLAIGGTFTARISIFFRRWLDMILKEVKHERLN